jgi:UPF0716 protein FxsA
MPVRWIPFIAFFLYVYIEISIFIQVAHVLGVLLTLILVIFTSVIGMSLVRNQGFPVNAAEDGGRKARRPR